MALKISNPPTAHGRADKLMFGYAGRNKTPVALMNGRAHWSPNPEYLVGDVVFWNNHINIPGSAGVHPLRGPNLDVYGPRFLPDTYDLELRVLADKAWAELDASKTMKMHEGVYAFASGPTYETRAEGRMLRAIGADMMGMSTVCVVAMSLIANMVLTDVPIRGDDPRLELCVLEPREELHVSAYALEARCLVVPRCDSSVKLTESHHLIQDWRT
ncbi:purine and uridine phosphorylase [Acephala macrosclerotiorum]|nr:purine and uridine phosphorylase [Acephala macrosclerotiorum]